MNPAVPGSKEHSADMSAQASAQNAGDFDARAEASALKGDIVQSLRVLSRRRPSSLAACGRFSMALYCAANGIWCRPVLTEALAHPLRLFQPHVENLCSQL